MRRVFVIRGFGSKQDSAGQVVDFDRVQETLIAPAMRQCGLVGDTTAEVVDAGNIRADMFALILEADLVICDITVHNANVFYELGIRHALRKRHTVMIKGDPSADATPFDLSTDRYLKYPVADPAQALDALVEVLQASLRSRRETDSPIFLMLPGLAEADPSELTMVPLDFIEEVGRAEAAGDKGWLRVIAEDLRGLRFQWDGLRRVARAQWSLKDLEGARTSWEAVRDAVDGDVEANLALANLYERGFRESRREVLLESSNQAIRQVMGAQRVTLAQQAEALALQGRNMKTLWRARFDGAADPAEARRLGLDARALHSYDSYRRAFYRDLNAFYPGLAALQMGTLLRLLADEPGWRNLFKGDKVRATRAREDLDAELPALAHVVGASIERAREQLPESDRLWADIADADLLFLTLPDGDLDGDASVLVQAYRDAIPPDKSFAWDATSGQLALFVQLGYRADAARAVLGAFETPDGPSASAREHLVVFAGHRIDAPGAPPRFPAAAEGRARELIAARLRTLAQGLGEHESLRVLAGAAPGADILLHEVCADLRLDSRLCLPMPVEAVARRFFAEADSWRSRFHAIVDLHAQTLLQLADQDGLPRWLQGREGVDPWERGNRWIMRLAQALAPHRATLLVLWDGQDTGATGGTSHLVRMARESGRFEIDVIDSRELLG
jgi:hypothetical protein